MTSRNALSALPRLVLIALGAEVGSCGGDSAPPVAISMQPSAAVGIDAGQHLALTATVTGDSMGMGVAWTVACPAGVANCGAMQSAASASGAADVFQPAAVNAAEAVQITATSVADRTKSSTVIVTVNPPPSASNQAQLQSTTYGTAYSLTLASYVQGGTPPLTCTISGGSLQDLRVV